MLGWYLDRDIDDPGTRRVNVMHLDRGITAQSTGKQLIAISDIVHHATITLPTERGEKLLSPVPPNGQRSTQDQQRQQKLQGEYRPRSDFFLEYPHFGAPTAFDE